MERGNKSERIALWLDRLRRHSTSGRSVAEFCQQEEISAPSFYQWKRRLSPRVETPREPRRRAARPQHVAKSRSGFAELVVSQGKMAQANLPGGITIMLGTEPHIAQLIVDRLMQHACPAMDLPGDAKSC